MADTPSPPARPSSNGDNTTERMRLADIVEGRAPNPGVTLVSLILEPFQTSRP